MDKFMLRRRRSRLALAKALASLAMASSGLLSFQALAQDASMVTVGQDNWLFAGWGSLTEVDEAGVRASTRLIAGARQALAARNVDLLVLVLPDKALIHADRLPPGTEPSRAVEGRYPLILDSLKQAGITAVDANAVLRQVQAEGKPVFYRTDQHWTLPAADATAIAVADLIRQTVGRLQGRPGSGLPLGNIARERRFGDLAELFFLPEERKNLPRETFQVRRQVDAQGLVDEADAPVHVSGNSMTQPYLGFPQRLSNALDRPVSLNWKQGNVGHWMILLEYLESPAFRQHQPQVLVWQMLEQTYGYGPQAQGWWDNASIMSAETWLSRVNAAVGQ